MSQAERPGAATKRGRRSLLAGVVAVALLAGLTTVGVQAAGASVTGTRIEICKAGAVSGSFPFSVDGSTTPVWVTVGTCRGVSVEPGTHTVQELADTSGATVLQRIQLFPSNSVGTKDVATRTATVTVPINGNVITRFVNEPNTSVLKVCKIAGDPAILGQSFSFTETAGGTTVGPMSVVAGSTNPLNCTDVTQYQVGTKVNVAELATPGVQASSIDVIGGTASNVNLSAGTVTATVGASVTEVIYTNVPVVNQPPGYLEVCKNAGDSYVGAGPWTFTITDAGGAVVGVEHVLAGQCSGDLSLPPGQYGVAETFSSPDYVSSISALNPNNLLGVNVANGTGTFSVSANSTTTAVFVNDVQTGYVKVCKTLTATSGALTGTTFNFNVSDAAGTQVVSVVASAPGETACSPDYTPLPVGSVATITEQSVPNVAVSGVQVIPAIADAGSTNTTAKVTVGTSLNSATFTNQALGYVEVCKNAGDSSVAGTFDFSVNGGPAIPVAVGQCSQAIQVPAGTATVSELQSNPNYYLANVSTQSVTDPTGSRLQSGSTNPNATVLVPYGGVGNETLVTFTNATLSSAFKVCTAQTSPDANLAGQSFTYDYSYTVNGVTTNGSVSLTVPTTGSQCSGILGTVPVINANGTPVDVSITAEVPTAISVDLAGFSYQGTGSVVSSPALPAAFPATATIALGTGMNVTTFVNGATH